MELIEELNELVVVELERGVEAMVGARELLAALAGARHPARPRLQLADHLRHGARCQIVGLEDSFDVILSAHEVGAPKPAPDPYLEACRRLGVEPGPDHLRARGLAERGRRRQSPPALTVIGIPSVEGVALDEAHHLAAQLA